MRWPWRRFESFFQRHLVRKGIDEMTKQRDMMLAAVNANSAWDEREMREAKKERLEAINEAWCQGVEIASGKGARDPEPDPFEQDPLFGPLLAMAANVRSSAKPPEMPQAGMGRKIIA